MAFARTVVRRIRSGVRRRVDRALDRFGLGSDAAPAPVSPLAAAAPSSVAAVSVAPVVSAVAPVVTAPAVEAPTDTVGAAILNPHEITRQQVEVLFEEMVRPALQSDGGDITLVKVESNDVYVELTGACQTCPSSIVTMQQGIQRLLEEEFPHFGRLIRVNG